jgi:glycosyltransferase involved in cell wall biosynthesis
LKLAVVIPWFGRELKGGAEQHAWQVASRLAGRGHSVEVLTTCCRSHQDDWATNHLAPGLFLEPEGFAIRRFPVDPRNHTEFDRVCAQLLALDPTNLRPGVSPVSPADSRTFATQLIGSAQLLNFIRSKKEDMDAFIFLPYLYGPILDGIQIVGRGAVLQPCLHDEAYAYLPEVAEAFRTAGLLLFISEGEQELALRLFGPGIWHKSVLVGAGAETSAIENTSNRLPSKKDRQPEKFLLYLGRKDTGKNVLLLLKAFARFRRVRPNSRLQLKLAGHGNIDLNGCQDAAVDLGLVSEEEKQILLHECSVLVQPSQNESFSRVIMEAWLHGKPVAAHARCLATAVAVERARGGWVADTEADWARLLTEIDRLPATALAELGENGRAYAQKMADWESVLDRYEAALMGPSRNYSSIPSATDTTAAINQFLPNLAHGDAISNEAILIRDRLRALGFKSEIYVRFIDPRMADDCTIFSPEAVMASSAIIYHHSIGTDITSQIVRYRGPKCLIYHNITPAEFFEPFRPQFAAILRKGRDELRDLAPHFPVALGVSSFNAHELAECGFQNPGILPICVDPEKWNIAPDPELMRALQDGRSNLIFVGRISPNKKQEDLVRGFQHYLAFDPTARLILVGTAEEGDPYLQYVREVIEALGLADAVVLPGNIGKAQLAAYYRTAHLFWSMSEHEGFGVPLIEAMWFDIPVFAFKAAATPETLGEAGLMFTKKDDLPQVAALAHFLVTDSTLRQKIIQAQRRRRTEFLPDKVLPILTNLVDKLCPSPTNARSAGGRPRRTSREDKLVDNVA